MHSITFTETEILECKKSSFWKMSEDELKNYIVKRLLNNKKVKTDNLKAVVTFIVKSKTFLYEKFSYRNYNSFAIFVESNTLEFVGADTVNNQEEAIDISYKTLSVVL